MEGQILRVGKERTVVAPSQYCVPPPVAGPQGMRAAAQHGQVRGESTNGPSSNRHQRAEAPAVIVINVFSRLCIL